MARVILVIIIYLIIIIILLFLVVIIIILVIRVILSYKVKDKTIMSKMWKSPLLFITSHGE